MKNVSRQLDICIEDEMYDSYAYTSILEDAVYEGLCGRTWESLCNSLQRSLQARLK